MNYTRYASEPERHNSARFDNHQFAGHGRFLRGSRLDFKDVQRMNIQRVADLRIGRKVETPAWVLSDAEFREVLVLYLESRFQIHKPTGSLKERLARCKVVGKERARNAKLILEKRVAEFREFRPYAPAITEERFSELPEHVYFSLFLGALRGRSLQRLRLQISCIDSEAAMSERAAELATACAYLYYRMGLNSPSVAEELKVIIPVHVRQIICRLNRAARRRSQGSPTKIGRPRSQNPSSVSGQIPENQSSLEKSSLEKSTTNGTTHSSQTRPDHSNR